MPDFDKLMRRIIEWARGIMRPDRASDTEYDAMYEADLGGWPMPNKAWQEESDD